MNKISKNEKKLIKLIKKWSDSEKRIWQEQGVAPRIPYFKSLLGDLKRKEILDLGSGMGGLLTNLKQKKVDAIGLDFNFDYCLITKLRGKRYDIDHGLIQGRGEKLPFKNNSFDLIFCLDVLEHVENPKKVLQEIKRVLKKNGKALITIINRYSLIDPHYRLPFINWLPRLISEWVINLKQRQKNYNLFKDNQRLSEMHYFSKKKFTRMSKKLDFKIKDIGFSKIKQPGLIQNKDLENKVRTLGQLGLAKPFYRFYSFFIQSTWEFLLYK